MFVENKNEKKMMNNQYSITKPNTVVLRTWNLVRQLADEI